MPLHATLREVEYTREEVGRVAYAPPLTCPWAAFRDPFVGDVLALYRATGGATEAGCVPARAIALDPPHVVYQGLQHYAQAASAVRAADAAAKRREPAREAPRGRRAAVRGRG